MNERCQIPLWENYTLEGKLVFLVSSYPDKTCSCLNKKWCPGKRRRTNYWSVPIHWWDILAHPICSSAQYLIKSRLVTTLTSCHVKGLGGRPVGARGHESSSREDRGNETPDARPLPVTMEIEFPIQNAAGMWSPRRGEEGDATPRGWCGTDDLLATSRKVSLRIHEPKTSTMRLSSLNWSAWEHHKLTGDD